MNPWLQHPVLLEGKRVTLRPLERADLPALHNIATNERIWEHYSVKGNYPAVFATEMSSALLMKTAGEQYPFVITDKQKNIIIGSTRLYNLYQQHRKGEIGWTFYHPDYWGTGYNTECKLLLLTYCFETLKLVRVQFQTNETNLRSRGAIEKIGATYEGLLRKERIISNGTFRNTMMYSITDEEWEGVKKMLAGKVNG
ncbi:MAG: GNAT family N-acetyltransferase [Taibaiella sp.]|nr:GNAT family N-acetyltransferase [Taibaiella sp.]